MHVASDRTTCTHAVPRCKLEHVLNITPTGPAPRPCPRRAPRCFELTALRRSMPLHGPGGLERDSVWLAPERAGH
eukprot:8790437-Alexandrium_andersonii.AAC.1